MSIFCSLKLQLLTLLHSERPKLDTILAFLSAIGLKHMDTPTIFWIYDTSSNDTSSTEPFCRKGFLSKCHFVECPLRRNRFSSNTFDEIFNAHLAAILYQLIT